MSTIYEIQYKFKSLPDHVQEKYIRKATFLVERNYAPGRSILDLAAEIYNTSNKNEDTLGNFVKGMIK